MSLCNHESYMVENGSRETLFSLPKFLCIIGCLVLWGLGIFKVHGSAVLNSSLILLCSVAIVYYALRSVMKDAIDVILAIIVIIVGISFLHSFQMYAISILCGFTILVVLFRRKKIWTLLTNDITRGMSLSLWNILGWFFLAYMLIFMGFTTSKGFFTADIVHPLYELSAGHSYAQTLFHAPDFSYIGKCVKFHFLSTQIPLLFSSLFHISLIDAVYFVTPFFFFILFFLLTQTLFKKYPFIRMPVFVLCFMPLFGWNASFCFDDIASRTVLAAPSYFLGFLLMGIAIYYLATRQLALLLFVSALLLLTKASFFLTLAGGSFLFFMRNREYRHVLFFVGALIPIFIVLYIPFLSNAHPHNAWLISPTLLYWGWVNKAVISIVLGLFLYAVVSRSYIVHKNNTLLLALASLGVSGMIGCCTLVELTELNSQQFWVAAYIGIALITWYTIKDFLAQKSVYIKRISWFIIACIMGVSSISTIKKVGPYNPIKSWYLVTHNDASNKKPSTLLNVFFASRDITDAYIWISNHTPSDSCILFGKQYETCRPATLVANTDDLLIAKKWYPDTGTMRSALSKRSMYVEEAKLKGICMEKDFSLRFANTLLFYKNFVVISERSRDIISWFYTGNYHNVSPRAENKGIKGKMRYYLGFKKNWDWNNVQKKAAYEINQYLKTQKPSESWAQHFLTDAGIDYIVLENNDKPSPFLQRITTPVYAHNSVCILKVKKENK